ncbi:MAG: type II toxin-antitoxin system PemK/MazF family toxin [Methanosarcinales archaeon]|jgi:mRNA-degrading endonuclease toxin of MazEF toxin-antitoxin module|nr:type II toxin-antitoxin system PemK/MazF family toxin [Methanosarcinales archaeon]
MKLGDIYLVDLPQINEHEQIGRRPAIIIQKGEL